MALDAYHRWLGIPPKEQPPDHYRLLSIQLFEQSPEVIEAAADRQMGHLRTYQAGEHSALSQKLLNEVAAARVCLLNPEKKAKQAALFACFSLLCASDAILRGVGPTPGAVVPGLGAPGFCRLSLCDRTRKPCTLGR